MDKKKLQAENHAANFRRLGINKIAHLDEPLALHLERTSQILLAMGCPEYVCLAGLYHGSYGTQGFHGDDIGDIPDSQRETLRECVSPKVEQLVYYFSVMSYGSLSKSFRNILKPGGIPELKDRRDGRDIPATTEQFEELLKLKLADVMAHAPKQIQHTCGNIPEKYGEFWEMVAEYLGGTYLSTWHSFVKK